MGKADDVGPRHWMVYDYSGPLVLDWVENAPAVVAFEDELEILPPSAVVLLLAVRMRTDGFTQKQIARELGVSASHVQRNMKLLRDCGLLDPARSESQIYFIQQEGGPVKIGVSNDVEKRLATLQTGSPRLLRLLGSIPGDELLEQEIHHRFSGHRLQGEWFEASPELMAFIDEVCS